MAYDERLAARIRDALPGRLDVVEKRMFGGIAFLAGGRMLCGIVGDDLMVRVGPARYETALARPHARPMDFTGRPMKGFVFVDPAGVRTTAALGRWLALALAASPPERPARRVTRRATPPRAPTSAPRRR